ncbi:hypothetical protein BEWA_034530 [Theileria equi strain WA]|uniref:Uncharacterized protein n=1 Tax=Theileria equi strain WA TaxID=1537102 RepID=L0AYF1_THEEQ|nr:hypothetical protein BEWA_034530 [Theileria equi strain WA]AFZ80595.1 hypothetical protein BEWA_034530 [Theileria equi strain WA]|eukprot:XP_004830261.1 hypothetical protein BEWA_034530 [Theileria equi strain WA]
MLPSVLGWGGITSDESDDDYDDNSSKKDWYVSPPLTFFTSICRFFKS